MVSSSRDVVYLLAYRLALLVQR